MKGGLRSDNKTLRKQGSSLHDRIASMTPASMLLKNKEKSGDGHMLRKKSPRPATTPPLTPSAVVCRSWRGMLRSDNRLENKPSTISIDIAKEKTPSQTPSKTKNRPPELNTSFQNSEDSDFQHSETSDDSENNSTSIDFNDMLASGPSAIPQHARDRLPFAELCPLLCVSGRMSQNRCMEGFLERRSGLVTLCAGCLCCILTCTVSFVWMYGGWY